ncbi:MAG: cytochrome c3 family protein [Acidobacteriota bacterium]
MDKRFPRLVYNPVSALGALIAVIAALTFLLLLGLTLSGRFEGNPYYGIFVYLVVPAFLLPGLILIPLGMWREARRRRREGETEIPAWPRIDLNKPHTRNAAIVFVIGTVVFLLMTAVGSNGAYEYSESVNFCGKTCHVIMLPEYTTYHNSPHARVACAQCHVGPGADWFVKSKLSGAYQVYATLMKKYPRPIPTPVHNLRPAQQTCEQCHWPGRIWGAQQKVFHHFKYDDANTEVPITLLLKVGGGDPAKGQPAGIHWHMNVGVKVEYIPRDDRRQDIPWIRVTDRQTGRQTIYQDKEKPLTAAEVAAAKPRTMDCVDCHNRPSHRYRTPDDLVDEALWTGNVDPKLPGIKRALVSAIAADYGSDAEAERGIANAVTETYRKEHPEVLKTQELALNKAVLAAQEAYRENMFPAMKARWDVYPDNIGHLRNLGCMRCHNSSHVSDQGQPLTTACTTCHTITSQGTGPTLQASNGPDGLPFVHPEDIGDAWKETACSECHTGKQP